MSIIGKLSENPNLQDSIESKDKLDEEKSILGQKIQKELTTEEFNNMSWENLKTNIRVVDNQLTLFGKPIEYWLINVDWTEKQLDGYDNFIEQYEKKEIEIIDRAKKQLKEKDLLTEIISIWSNEAQKQATGIWFSSFRDDDNIINQSIKDIKNKIKEVGVPISEEIFIEEINDIFILMNKAESQEDIIGENDLKDIKDIFLNKKSTIEEKEIKIFNIMRYGGLSGNSIGVKDVIVNKLIEKEGFKTEKELLQNPKLIEYLEDKNIDRLEEILGMDLAESILNIYNKTEESSLKWLRHNLRSENEERRKENKKLINLEDYKKETNIYSNILIGTLESFKHILISYNLEQKINRGNENSSLSGIYANISGLSEKKGFGDYITISDDNIDLATEFASTIAIGLVTMGVGIGATILAKSAIKGIKMASYLNRASNTSKILYKTTQALKVGKYGKIQVGDKIISKGGYVGEILGNSVIDGIAFHEGATLMQNVMFREFENMGEGLTNSSDIIKSIAFMGGLHSLQFVSKMPGMGKIMNYEMKIPKDYLKPSVIKKVLINTGNFSLRSVKEGSIMFGISGATEEWLGEGWNPSVEEYLHFVALIQIMHLKDIQKR